MKNFNLPRSRCSKAALFVPRFSLFALLLSPFALLQPEALAQANLTSHHVCLGGQVTHFTLINADTDESIGWYDMLGHGETLNLATLPTRNLNIQINTDPEILGGVIIGWDGNPNFRTDTDAPYSLAGDSNDDYETWTPTVGLHTITATPYTGLPANSSAGTSLTVFFNVIDTPPPNCTKSLQQMINEAVPGAVLHVPACLYRERVTINKPLTLIADPGAEIRGSEVWTGWTRQGNLWVSANAVPFFFAHGECRPGTDERCKKAEQVFFNGRALFQVAANPSSGQFALNNSRQILLADDPTGQSVEVTTRRVWIEGQADNVTIQGFRMRHCANDAQEGAIKINNRLGWVVQDNVLSEVHGAVVTLYCPGRGNNKILHNDIFRGGQLGIGGCSSNTLIEGNWIHHNHTEDFFEGWEAGGLKMVLSENVTFDANEFYNNDGTGLWLDIDVKNVIISNNRLHHNQHAGIYFEISDGAKIFGNKVWENGWSSPGWGWDAGIVIASSRHAEVHDNVVAWNGDGISVISQRRDNNPNHPWNHVIGNYVHDNDIIINDEDTRRGFLLAMAWLQDWAGVMFADTSNNRGAENTYWHPNPEGRWLFTWGDAGYNQLSAFNATPGEENGRFLSDGEKDQILSAAGIPSFFAQTDTDSVDVTCFYKPAGNPSVVYLPGGFNNWQRSSISQMTKDPATGIWSKTLRLRVGRVMIYKFNEDDTRWLSDPLNPRMAFEDNNSYLNLCNPTIHYLLPNSVSGVVKEHQPEISTYIFPATTTSVDTASITVKIDNMTFKHLGAGYDPLTQKFTFRSPVALADGRHRLELQVRTLDNTITEDTTSFTVQAGPLEVTESGELLPKQFALRQNFPNPFNPETKIRFDLPEQAEVTVRIFNLLGEEVVTLKQEKMPAGTHTLSWDGRNKAGQVAPNGVYFLRVEADNKVATKKLLLVR
jgi:parallel beta-helix repeat protein